MWAIALLNEGAAKAASAALPMTEAKVSNAFSGVFITRLSGNCALLANSAAMAAPAVVAPAPAELRVAERVR